MAATSSGASKSSRCSSSLKSSSRPSLGRVSMNEAISSASDFLFGIARRLALLKGGTRGRRRRHERNFENGASRHRQFRRTATRARIRWCLVHTHEAPQLVCGSRSEGERSLSIHYTVLLRASRETFRFAPRALPCLSHTICDQARNARIPASCDMFSQPQCLTLACTVFIHGSSRPPSPSSLTRWSGPHSAYEPLASARGSCQAGCAPCSRCTRRSVPPPRTALTGWPPRCTCRAAPSGAP